MKANIQSIKMSTYDEAKTYANQLLDPLNLYVPGDYLGTKPYYFKNITPVLEYGDPPPCVEYYSQFGYKKLNKALQGPGRNFLQSLDSIDRQYLEDLILFIQVKGKYYPKVYRGISNPDATSKYLKMKVGDTLIKEAFMSTSISEDIAVAFSKWNNFDTFSSPSVMLYLEVPSNVKGFPISYMEEDELLFPPRSGFKITKIEDYDIDIGEPNEEYIRKRRKIYATLFIDPIFRTLNKSGKFITSIS